MVKKSMAKKLAKVKAPKRPPSAFILWMEVERCSVMKELKLDRRDFIKAVQICSERWKKLSEELKRPWHEKCKSLFEKYKSEMAIYKQTTFYQADVKLAKERRLNRMMRKVQKPKDPNAPKKPLPVFLEFQRNFRKNNSGTTVGETARAAGKAWSTLEESEKNRLLEVRREKTKVYERLHEEYKKTSEFSAFQEKLQDYERKRQQIFDSVKKSKRVNIDAKRALRKSSTKSRKTLKIQKSKRLNIAAKRTLHKGSQKSLRTLKKRKNRKKYKAAAVLASLGMEEKSRKRRKEEAVVTVVPLEDEETESDSF